MRRSRILLWFALGVGLFVFFKGCIPLLGWRMSLDDEHVERISGYRKGERFRLNQDVFVVQSHGYDLGLKAVGVPRQSRSRIRQGSYYSVPATVDEWKSSIKDSAQGTRTMADQSYCSDIEGVLPRGTELVVSGRKVVYAVSWWYGFVKDYYIMASCEVDGKRTELEISDLTNWRTKAPLEEFVTRVDEERPGEEGGQRIHRMMRTARRIGND